MRKKLGTKPFIQKLMVLYRDSVYKDEARVAWGTVEQMSSDYDILNELELILFEYGSPDTTTEDIESFYKVVKSTQKAIRSEFNSMKKPWKSIVVCGGEDVE